MPRRHSADKKARSAWQKLWRQRRRRSRTARSFELVAAFIPAVVMIMHLSLKASAVTPAAPLDRAIVVSSNDAQVTLTQQVPEVTAVPEPNAGVLVGLGFGAVLYARRKAQLQNPATA